ncbi:MAG: phenylalanine--tRNA ligase subunit beta, partial [Bacteroidales bacterium]|nr:phenylalanine--tRNA ligase subunit beta [Bacteroidales bacterium]
MKISYNWLKKYIDFNLGPEELSEILTDCGLEVEGLEKIQSIKGGLNGFVVGEVLTKEKHPNADKLSVTTVDIGEEHSLNIVCGAPNVATGQKVIVATIGSIIYSGDEEFKIKKTKLRGEISEGMICAEDEMGMGTSHDGIMVLNPEAKTGTSAKKHFNIREDYVYEIGLTPNRSDATSHIGTARDLVSVLNHLNNTRDYKLNIPSVDDFKTDNYSKKIDVIVKDQKACPRYSGLTISNIEVKESPDWLKNQLNSIEVRPINNIVDITNFVLFETGQPLHAFDADKIIGKKIIVKKYPKGTKFTTLDEIERELSDNDLMICNEKGGMCIAGVFGGMKSGVTEKTKNIFLESAYFDPTSVRKTSKHHGLQTDASFRFERGADPQITTYALKRAALLIKKITGGEISSDIVDFYPEKIEKWIINILYKNVDRLIGKEIDRTEIKNILQDLDIKIINETEKGLKLLIPTFKVDVTREADIIEEILRIYGYNNIEIPTKVKSSLSFRSKPDTEKLQNLISDQLSDNGFYEIMNNSLTNSDYIEKNPALDAKNNIRMLNPISRDLDILRQTLLYGGLESIAYNHNRKISDIKFYEFGKIYLLNNFEKEKDVLSKYFEEKHLSLFLSGRKNADSWKDKESNVDFFDLKIFTNNIIKRLKININMLDMNNKVSKVFSEGLIYKSNNKKLIEFGSVSPNILNDFDIKQDVFYADINWDFAITLINKSQIEYKKVSKFPAVKRDLALLINKNVTFDEIEKIAFQTDRHLLKSIKLFDVFEGDKIGKDKKSYAVSFILQNPEKTLNDKIIDKTMNKFIKVFEEKLNAKI